MRALLDECLPRGLIRELPGHEIKTVAELGWSGVSNGELLQRAAGQFDFLLTIDQRFSSGTEIPVTLTLITLAAESNRLASLRPLVHAIDQALRTPRGGERIRISA